MLWNTLWDQQKRAVEFVLKQEASALFFEQRTGKTFITMGVLERLPRDNLAAVLFCLLNNRDSTWKDQIAANLPWLNVTDDYKIFLKLPFPKLFLVHFEAAHKVVGKLRTKKWINFAIVDEAHGLKNRGSRQSRSIGRLWNIPKRLILTGTPIDKGQQDLWGQFRFLKPDLLGSYEDFENEYLEWRKIDLSKHVRGSFLWKERLKLSRMLKSKATFNKRKASKFRDLIKPFCMRVTKDDVGILRPEVKTITVPMSTKQRRVYDDISRDQVARIGRHRIMTPLEVTSIMKKRQIASGFVVTDDEELVWLSDNKVDACLELFERLPKPIVIFTVFDPEADAVVETLTDAGYDVAMVRGDVAKKKRPDIWRAFQRGELDAVVCQVKTGGVGVDLWKASHGIFFSLSHSYITFDQAKSRMDHKNKRKRNTLWILCSENSIDTDIYDLVVVKEFSAREALDGLKRIEKKEHRNGKDKRKARRKDEHQEGS